MGYVELDQRLHKTRLKKIQNKFYGYAKLDMLLANKSGWLRKTRHVFKSIKVSGYVKLDMFLSQ